MNDDVWDVEEDVRAEEDAHSEGHLVDDIRVSSVLES